MSGKEQRQIGRNREIKAIGTKESHIERFGNRENKQREKSHLSVFNVRKSNSATERELRRTRTALCVCVRVFLCPRSVALFKLRKTKRNGKSEWNRNID